MASTYDELAVQDTVLHQRTWTGNVASDWVPVAPDQQQAAMIRMLGLLHNKIDDQALDITGRAKSCPTWNAG